MTKCFLQVKEEEREHGVFYDDDYNYLQHLKEHDQNQPQLGYVNPVEGPE